MWSRPPWVAGWPSLTARDRVVGYTPHVRVDVVLAAADVDRVLAALRGSQSGVAGRGRYWISAVDDSGRL